MYALRACKSDVWIDKNQRISEKGETDAPGDTLQDFEISRNETSIYLLDHMPIRCADEEDPSLRRILCAIVANRQRLSAAKYLVFPLSIIEDLGFVVTKSPGHTKDLVVNDLHSDIQGLTAHRAASLVNVLWTHAEVVWCEIPTGQLAQWLREAITAGHIPEIPPDTGFWGKYAEKPVGPHS